MKSKSEIEVQMRLALAEVERVTNETKKATEDRDAHSLKVRHEVNKEFTQIGNTVVSWWDTLVNRFKNV